MSTPLFPQDATGTDASTSPTSTTTATPTSTSGGPSNSGNTPASATLLFGFLVIFVALFCAIMILGFIWQYQRHRRAAQAAAESDENGGGRAYGGRVPKLWEVWIQDEPSYWEWDSIRPLSVEVDHTSPSGQKAITTVATRTRTRSRLSWLRNPFHRRPVPLPQLQQQQPDDTDLEAPAPISGVRMSFVIAMPHADAPARRRSAISQVSSVGANWRRRDYAIGIYHSPFREEVAP